MRTEALTKIDKLKLNFSVKLRTFQWNLNRKFPTGNLFHYLCGYRILTRETRLTKCMHKHDRLIFFLNFPGHVIFVPLNSIAALFFISYTMKYKWLKMFIKSFYRFSSYFVFSCLTCFDVFSTLLTSRCVWLRTAKKKLRQNIEIEQVLLNASSKILSVRLTLMLRTLNNPVVY